MRDFSGNRNLKITNLSLPTMAVLYKWFGLVLYALTCLAIANTEAKCGGRTLLTDLQGTISDGPKNYPANTLCEWLIKGE